jgi:hypothetical protein
MKRIFLLAGLALAFSSCFPVYRTVRPEPVVSGSGFVPVSPAPQPVPVQQPTPVVSGGVVIYVSGGIQVSRIIGDFQPTKGEGASYVNGERLVLRADVAYPGYMTLLIYNPQQWDNSVLTNIPVQAGLNLISQLPNGAGELGVAPPFGVTRIRAIYTPRPIALGSWRWVSAQDLNRITAQMLNPYNVGERDFAETYVNVRQ